jgi:hypothetical protein
VRDVERGGPWRKRVRLAQLAFGAVGASLEEQRDDAGMVGLIVAIMSGVKPPKLAKSMFAPASRRATATSARP